MWTLCECACKIVIARVQYVVLKMYVQCGVHMHVHVAQKKEQKNTLPQLTQHYLSIPRLRSRDWPRGERNSLHKPASTTRLTFPLW